MNFKNIVKAAIASAILMAPITSAYAYSIHYKNGKYYVTCDNGDRWTRGNGSQQITHADAANICAKRGSSIIAPDFGPTPESMKKASAGVVKLN